MLIQQKKSLRRLGSQVTIPINDPPADPDYIAHFGILGMKWGIRRYQNKDGSLTPAGKKRYNGSEETRDKGLGPGAKSNGKSSGTGIAVGTAAGAAFAASTAFSAKRAMKGRGTDYRDMKTSDIETENKRAKAIKTYKKNHGIKDSPEDVINETGNVIEGIRKFRNAGQQQGNQVQNRYNTRRTLSQKEMDSMSDKDLQQLVNRLNLETNYSRLTQDPPSIDKVDVGLQKVSAILGIAASAATIGVSASYVADRFVNKKK